MANLYKQFRDLLPADPLLVGTVVAVDGDLAVIEQPGGGLLNARGVASVGRRVFVRGGAIEGEAPDLPYVEVIL